MQGITLGPGSATALSTLVLRGELPDVLLPFSPARFTRTAATRTAPRSAASPASQKADRPCLVSPSPSPASSPPSPPRSPPTARRSTRPRSPPRPSGSSHPASTAWCPAGRPASSPTLTPDEHRRVIELYVEAAAGRVPVIAGVGALSTAAAIDLAQDAERLGADAVMLVPPFYDPLDFATLTTFLRAVAESISLPIVYYNVPGATGIRLDANQIAELGEIDGVDYLKDTSGDAVTLTDLLVNRTDKIKAFNGWDTLTFIGIASGAEASVWGAAGVVPELAVQLWDTLAVKGDLAEAREQWRHLWAISDFLESVNYVAGVKAGLELIGHPAGPPRAPIQPLSGRAARHLRARSWSGRAYPSCRPDASPHDQHASPSRRSRRTPRESRAG